MNIWLSIPEPPTDSGVCLGLFSRHRMGFTQVSREFAQLVCGSASARSKLSFIIAIIMSVSVSFLTLLTTAFASFYPRYRQGNWFSIDMPSQLRRSQS